MLDRLVKFFTSLRLTVTLLGLGAVLVFFGTLAQESLGLYDVQARFFQSCFVDANAFYAGVHKLFDMLGQGFGYPLAPLDAQTLKAHSRFPLFPGGYLLGGLLLINLFSAHLRYYQPGKKKWGIVMIHLGIVLLLLGQLLTDRLSNESFMHIREGASKNYSEAPRNFELAVIDTTEADADKVVAIPWSTLRKRREITHPDLPVTVKVKTLYGHSALSEEARDGYAPVNTTAGFGAKIWWRELPHVTAMDDKDIPSGIVELATPQAVLGTFLVSGFLTRPQEFEHNGRHYQMELRPTRSYKPFSLRLLEFRFDRYAGTDTPKNYSSRVRVQRPATGEDREVLIKMNSPLRYAGETFYQASFDKDDEKGTVLQVVHNPSWLTPYFSCVLVAAGMIYQFLSHLIGFATKKNRMKTLLKCLPWFFVALFATEVVVVLMPKKDGEFHTREFGRLPVLLGGRIQPFDSVARNSLLQIRSTGDVPLELLPSWQFWRHPKKLRSTEWLLEAMFRPEVANTRPIFLIHHPDLISEFKLGEKGIEKSGLRYYSYQEIEPVWVEIYHQSTNATAIKDAERTPYQKQVLKLANAVILYQRIQGSIQPPGTQDFLKLVEDYKAALPAGVAAFRAQQAGETGDEDALRRLAQPAQMFDALARFAYPMVIPPVHPKHDRDGWLTTGTSLLGSIQSGEIHPAVNYFARMATAYGQTNSAEFNSAVAGYKNWLAPQFGKEVAKGRAEFYFNDVKAFLHAIIIYIFAFVLAGGALLTLGSFPNLSETLRRSSYYLIALAFVVHTFGLIFRMALEGRPPVTNLYSSAIFIGWGACLLGLILERVYKVGLGCAVAGFAGFITLLIAHNLALGGDTMTLMQAVLDTNFWLATHVVVVTLGYASTFFAGLLAIAYILLGLFTPILSTPLGKGEAAGRGTAKTVNRKPVGTAAAANATAIVKQPGELIVGKALGKMVYAIICFAALFSFVGTVLGGIWADQSWGRFWGWDPKENGALLIVIWNVLILHARWGGLVRERGLMGLAVFGNIVTSFSWFGVNMLGIGLHSYGFMEEAFKWLLLFIASQVAIILLGQIPLNFWKSFRRRDAAPTQPGGPASGKISPAPAGA